MQYTNGYDFDRGYSLPYSPRMTIGDRLDQAMKAAKFESQKELEEESGVPQATISRILGNKGKKGPETETIKSLARACNVTFAWLNEGLGDDAVMLKAAAERPRSTSGKAFADELIEVIRGYKEGDSEDRGIILRQARVVLNRRRRRLKSPSVDQD